MTNEQRNALLLVPKGPVDVILDTDTYNEIDDPFALSYLINCGEKLTTVGITAAPFLNSRSTSPADGMEKSYREIRKLLRLAGREDLTGRVYRGADRFLPDENTPVVSDAARFIVEKSKAYSPENPLYVAAIAAVTNVASALLIDPSVSDRIVVVWLGGAAAHMPSNDEFNLNQDIAAARVVCRSGVPYIQLPCLGVVDRFATTRPELEHWLVGRGPLCDYLARCTIEEAEQYAAGRPWSRVIWDVTAVAWLMNEGGRFLKSLCVPMKLPNYEHRYEPGPEGLTMRYVIAVERDPLMEDLFRRLRGETAVPTA